MATTRAKGTPCVAPGKPGADSSGVQKLHAPTITQKGLLDVPRVQVTHEVDQVAQPGAQTREVVAAAGDLADQPQSARAVFQNLEGVGSQRGVGEPKNHLVPALEQKVERLVVVPEEARRVHDNSIRTRAAA